MPYDVSNPPAKIKSLSAKKKRTWIKAFNNAFKQYGGDEGKAHATAWAAVKKDVVDELAVFAGMVSSVNIDKDSDSDSDSSSDFSDDSSDTELSDAVAAAETVPVNTPEGARAMAIALTRMFGGWRGGCRISPSATRGNAYHITVFSENEKDFGKKILSMRNQLMAQGFKEVGEGVFHNGLKTVHMGRSYGRKGRCPLAFMATVQVN
jgi:cation transport regulator ChaB